MLEVGKLYRTTHLTRSMFIGEIFLVLETGHHALHSDYKRYLILKQNAKKDKLYLWANNHDHIVPAEGPYQLVY